ncbi:MAG: LCP family protein [Clostridia bacterium]|nr:LCP family protein [Clostridia bacterium]
MEEEKNVNEETAVSEERAAPDEVKEETVIPEESAPKKKMGKVKKALLIVLIVILSLAVLLVGTYFVLRAIGKSHFHPAVMNIDNIKDIDNVVGYDEGKTIKYDGKTYVYNEDVIFVAFMGVDKETLDPVEGLDHSAGQSDTNMLIAVNTETGKVSLIVIPRDSMTDVNVLSAEGKRIGISEMQLCLAYAYGNGRDTSCENVLESMERLLYGIEIDNYYSLDLAGISALNDAVGGVEVKGLETVSGVCKEGENVTLWGKSAQAYVQRRNTDVFNSDSLRRKRQIQYAKAFAAKAFSLIKSDFTKVTDIYGIADDYSCTNFDITRVTYLASVLVDKYSSFSIKDEDIYVLPGEATMPGKFLEVRLDRTAVFETILKVFYTEQ